MTNPLNNNFDQGKSMDVSIIIINYKSAKLVLDCIQSIYEQTKASRFEIIVVDNQSNDDCQQQLAAVFPATRWLQTGYNAGFARANNAGIDIAKGEFILILNADTLILDGAIDKSLQQLKSTPYAVGCGVQLLNTDGSNQISGAHFVKGGLNTLLPLPYLGKFIRYMGYRLKAQVPSVETITDKIEVDWVVGAYILVKKSVLKNSGLMDADFFMYAEEIEWCSRLRQQGKLYLFSEPRVTHIGGGTSSDYYNTTENENGKNLWNKKGRQIIVSTLLRIRKQFGLGWFLCVLSIYLLEIPIFLIGLCIEKIIRPKSAKFTWTNWVNYTKNMGVLLRYFFTMLLNKPHFYKVA